MQYKIGDKVQRVNDSELYTVIALAEASVILEDEHGFTSEVSIRELLPAESAQRMRTYLAQPSHLHMKADDLPARKEPRSKQKASKIKKTHEVDLHMHELTESNRGLSNFEMLTLQMNFFYKALDEARKERASRLIVIHGVGKGVLKSEIRKALRQMEDCTFMDADYLKYGYGATEISFHGI